MTLKEIVASLSEYVGLELAIRFLEIGLPIWDDFSQKSIDDSTTYGAILELELIDSKIISLSIQLGKAWIQPKSAAMQAKLETDLKGLLSEFSMCLCLKPDLDPHIELIFHAAYNFLDYINKEAIPRSQKSMIYASINQSIDAIIKVKLLTEAEINTILKTYQ
jgi:hypothetical protein